MEVTETVIPFLFESHAYAAERYDMDRVLGRQSRDFKGFMASLDGVKEFLKYVGTSDMGLRPDEL